MLLASLASAPALAQTPPAVASPPAKPGLTVELSTLRLLREKGILSQAEYDSALRDIGDTSGTRTGDDTTLVVSKFAATIYGFIEADSIWDSTQSFNDVAGNAAVAPQSSYAGSHSRMQFGVRNSRLGIRLKSPETKWFRASGVLEADFLGATLPIGAGQPYYGTEAAYFNNPTFRLRHAYLKFETPVVDILMGQAWHPFGWGGNYQVSSVNILGLVGEVYNRTTQIRLSHAFTSDYVSFELAIALVRPPQRDAGVPERTAGFQLAFPRWAGMQTLGATGTRIAPASIAVTADARNFLLPPLSGAPTTNATKYNGVTGSGIAVDAFLPIIPATKEKKGNSLALSGEFSYGHGIGDLYTGLTGGVANPPLPNPMMATPAPSYTPGIDAGLAAYSSKTGVAAAVQWTTFSVGVQYYFPALDGRLSVSGNYLRASSANSGDFLGVAADAPATAVAAAQGKVRNHEVYYDANIFGDPYPGLRFGLGYAHIADTYVSGVTAVNHRVQFSGFYIF
jgi:hypothetical protein